MFVSSRRYNILQTTNFLPTEIFPKLLIFLVLYCCKCVASVSEYEWCCRKETI